MSENRYSKEFIKGLWQESPTFRQIIGMCPTLAVTTSVINGMSMGLATAFVLISSSTVVSLIKDFIPRQVRLAAYVVIIAAFVTVADLFLAANFPPISKALGPYVPLIVVNCLILARAEAFASKNSVSLSITDAAGMGAGFVWALMLLGLVREIIGQGKVFGLVILGNWWPKWLIMLLPPGAFITLGLLLGLINHLTKSRPTSEGHVH